MKIKTIILSSITMLWLLMPVFALAQSNNADCTILEQQFRDLGVLSHSDSVNNDINSILTTVPKQCSVQHAAITIIQVGLAFAATLAIIFLTLGGFQIMLGSRGGESEGVTKGKKTVTYAIVGLIVVILAELIVRLVARFVIQGGL